MPKAPDISFHNLCFALKLWFFFFQVEELINYLTIFIIDFLPKYFFSAQPHPPTLDIELIDKTKKGVVNWRKWICIWNKAQIEKRNKRSEERKTLCDLKLDPLFCIQIFLFCFTFFLLCCYGKEVKRVNRTQQRRDKVVSHK